MKKNVLFLLTLLLAGEVQPCMAQQRKSVAKKTVVTKKVTTAKKPIAAPATVTIDDPVIVNGHVAFLGVPVKQPEAKIKQQLQNKGLTPKSENGFQFLGGTVYGVAVKAFVDSENQIAVRESKAYTKSAARNRVNAYQKAFVNATGGKIVENTMGYNSDEEGGLTIETSGGKIDIHYSNQDEVNFNSKYFDIIITFVQD